MSLLPRSSSLSRRARWAVPAGTVAVVAAGLLVVPAVADASSPLPARSAAELLASTRDAADHPLSGTVSQTAALGLPDLPGASSTSLSVTSLVTGTHTARVWYAAPDRARVALVGDLAETNVVRSGSDVWTWSSEDRTASHTILPATGKVVYDGSYTPLPEGSATATAPDTSSMTPTQAAERVLAAIDPTTEVTVDGAVSVAGRSAYELVLAPRDAGSLVGQVRLAIDADTSTPLRVQVFARGASDPAFETGFTSVSFATPDASVFAFTPPAGAKVTTTDLSSVEQPHDERGSRPQSAAEPTVIGEGWTAVASVPGVELGSSSGRGSSRGASSGSDQVSALLSSADRVSGSWGSGRVLTTALVTALLTDDGRLYVGAVTPAVLERAAASAAR